VKKIADKSQDECIKQLEELCRVRASLDTNNPQWRGSRLAGAKSQLERRFVHISGEYASGEYASGEYASRVTNDLLSGERSMLRSRVYGAVINSNHIEPRRVLEDASNIVPERVRDAVERHGSVKVNTASTVSSRRRINLLIRA